MQAGVLLLNYSKSQRRMQDLRDPTAEQIVLSGSASKLNHVIKMGCLKQVQATLTKCPAAEPAELYAGPVLLGSSAHESHVRNFCSPPRQALNMPSVKADAPCSFTAVANSSPQVPEISLRL